MMDVDATAYVEDPNNIAEDIKKFEELLNGGIITQEEFDKKKQVLGI